MPIAGAIQRVVMNDHQFLISREHDIQLDTVCTVFKSQAERSQCVFGSVGRIPTMSNNERYEMSVF